MRTRSSEWSTKKPRRLVSGIIIGFLGVAALAMNPASKKTPQVVEKQKPVVKAAAKSGATPNKIKSKTTPKSASSSPKVSKKLRPGSFDVRMGSNNWTMMREFGGTKETAAAVVRGIRWLVRVQEPNGSWRIDGIFKDKGDRKDETAGTAFGLLPLLGAGYTHLPVKGKPSVYNKPIERGLVFLIRNQDRRTGNYGGNMYSHGLATIAMCEAYALSKDARLKATAQIAVNYIVRAQHAAGGWRYSPGQVGDLSVTGWQVCALKTAQIAGLSVPQQTLDKAILFLNNMMDKRRFGYGYTNPVSRPTTTAIGLLLRMHLQKWDPSKKELAEPVKTILMKSLPDPKWMSPKKSYSHFFATQVLFHYGGPKWKIWNQKMRDMLINTQYTKESRRYGSWSPQADAYGKVGGRLMTTCFALRTLEIYNSYVPYHYGQNRVARAELRMAVIPP